MDKLFKAVIAGFLTAVLLAALAPVGSDAEPSVFLFPQLSISAACDKTPSGQKNTDSPEVVYAFKLSEILDCLAERHHSI